MNSMLTTGWVKPQYQVPRICRYKVDYMWGAKEEYYLAWTIERYEKNFMNYMTLGKNNRYTRNHKIRMVTV